MREGPTLIERGYHCNGCRYLQAQENRFVCSHTEHVGWVVGLYSVTPMWCHFLKPGSHS